MLPNTTLTSEIFIQDTLDYMDPQSRDELIFQLFKAQFIHNKKHVPFYSRLYRDIDEKDLKSLNDCIQHVPATHKSQLRSLKSPYDLLDQNTRKCLGKLYVQRGTGGSTGEPVSLFFSKNDWDVVVSTLVRPLKALQSLGKTIVAFNGYNQGHISGPVFDDMIRRLGGLSIPRHFNSTDDDAIKLMKRHKCNVIIAPSISTHKGGSIEDLLEADARSGQNYINGENIDCIVCSSTEMTQELYEELQFLGITNVYNFYGSTDVLPTAVSTPDNPLVLHLLPGHIAIFVVNEKQEHVKDGERGLVIASRIASVDDNGNIVPNQGSQIMNFYVGDEVLFNEANATNGGRTTPTIRAIQRVLNTEDKVEGGCEVW